MKRWKVLDRSRKVKMYQDLGILMSALNKMGSKLAHIKIGR